MQLIVIEGRLLQGKLEDALKQIVGSENWLGKSRFVPDAGAGTWGTKLTFN